MREELKIQDDRVADKIKLMAVEESVEKRIEKKASWYHFGDLMREFADVKLSLAPLIEKKVTLERFIS